MTVRGDYYVRDLKGDRLCSVWSEEPVLDHGEWVPARQTHGEQVYVPCSNSFAAKHVGHPLRPGEMAFVALENRVESEVRLPHLRANEKSRDRAPEIQRSMA
jgi:hypothetical protein